MKALVLSGGGSKGAYQIGVWKALKKLNIKYDIVTGTSVGALNGALMTQRSYHKAISLWKKINLKVLFGENAVNSTDNLKVVKMYTKNFLKNGGMEVRELETLIEKYINHNRFYKSKINYGLVTYNLSTKNILEIEKKDIPKDLLADYLMASASCYPAFQHKDIKGDKYIDGGYKDNLPINLALSMGADEIIAVDLSAPGLKRKPNKKIPTITIKPNNKLSNFLNFNEEGAKRNIKLGYNDTLKVFNKLEGSKYTLKKGHISKNRTKHEDTFAFIFNEIIDSEKLIDSFKKVLKVTSTIDDELTNKLLIRIMESLGKTFNLDETKIYSYKSFNKELRKQIAYLLKNEPTKRNQLKLVNLYKKVLNKEYKELRKDALINPIEFLKALYLYSICEV